MNSNECMLGNLVRSCDDNETGFIVAIEKRVVHLSNRKRADDERDIEGVPLTNWINEQSNGSKKGEIIITIKGVRIGLIIKRSEKKAILLFPINRHSNDLILAYFHQLQNLVFVLTGQKLDPEQKWDVL